MSGFMDLLEQHMTADPAPDPAAKPPVAQAAAAAKPQLTGGQRLGNGLAAMGNAIAGGDPQPPMFKAGPAPKPVISGAPAAPSAPQSPPPGWREVPVQADAKSTYMPPAGWTVPGQAPAPTPPQALSTSSYVPPPGWQVPGQPVVQQVLADRGQQQQASLDQALAQRFQK